MTVTTTAVGNLTRDPEARFTANGQAVCSMRIACDRRWRDASGEWKEATTYLNVTAWGMLGENVAASLVKGNRIVATGHLTSRTWEGTDGSKHEAVELTADDIAVSLLFRPNDGSTSRDPRLAPDWADGHVWHKQGDEILVMSNPGVLKSGMTPDVRGRDGRVFTSRPLTDVWTTTINGFRCDLGRQADKQPRTSKRAEKTPPPELVAVDADPESF